MSYNTQELEKKAQEAIQQYQIYFPDEFLEAALAEMYKRGYEELTPTIQSLQKQLEEERGKVIDEVIEWVEGQIGMFNNAANKFPGTLNPYVHEMKVLHDTRDFLRSMGRFTYDSQSTVPTDSTTPQSTSVQGGEQATAILKTLVDLKNLKDELDFSSVGNPEAFIGQYLEYRTNKDKAWQQAKDFLAASLPQVGQEPDFVLQLKISEIIDRLVNGNSHSITAKHELYTILKNEAPVFTYTTTEQESEGAGGWVSVDDRERLPDYDQYCLWYTEDGNYLVECLDKDGNPWLHRQETEGFAFGEVTHWQPLPTPPSAEKKEEVATLDEADKIIDDLYDRLGKNIVKLTESQSWNERLAKQLEGILNSSVLTQSSLRRKKITTLLTEYNQYRNNLNQK